METRFADEFSGLDGERSLVEQQASKILFLEWKSNSEEREYRQKNCDMTWKIASLEKEIEVINKDRISLKSSILQLEASLRSVEDELKAAQKLCQSYEHYKFQFQNGQKEIMDLNSHIRILKAERIKHIQFYTSEQQRMQRNFRLLVQECDALTDDMSEMLSLQKVFHQDMSTMVRQLCKGIDSSIKEVIEVKTELGLLCSNSNHHNLQMKGNESHAGIFVTRESVGDVLGTVIHDNEQVSMVREGITENVQDFGTAIADIQAGHEHFTRLSNMIRTVKAIGDECDICASLAVEIRESLYVLRSNYQREIVEHRDAVSTLLSFLSGDPIHKHLLLLPASLEQLKHSMRCTWQSFASDDFVSDLSTVSAMHDTPSRSVQSLRPTIPYARYLKGLRYPRSGMGMATLGERIIFAGGTDGRSVWSEVEYFDLNTCVWGVITSMPTPRICFQLVPARAKLYFIGGEDQDGRVLSSCTEFDPKTEKWSELSPMRIARTGFGAQFAESHGLIVVAGGWNGEATIANTEIYDIEHDKWYDLDFPGSECLFSRQRSPASSPSSARCGVEGDFASLRSSGGGIYGSYITALDQSQRQDSSVKDHRAHPDLTTADMDRIIAEFDEKAAHSCNSMQQDILQTAEMLRRFVNSSQTSLRQARAEDCFNRAKIESLRSQICAMLSSHESQTTHHKMLSCHQYGLVCTLIHDCRFCATEILYVIKGEKESLTSSEEILRAPSKVCERCQHQASCLKSMWSSTLAERRNFTVHLSELMHISKEAIEESECLKKYCLQMHSKISKIQNEFSYHRLAVGAIWKGLDSAINDTQQLQISIEGMEKRSVTAFDSRMTLFHCLSAINEEIQSCQQEVATAQESLQQVLQDYVKQFSYCNHTFCSDAQISKLRVEEQKHFNEMINLLGTEVVRRLEAEKEVEALSQLLVQHSKSGHEVGSFDHSSLDSPSNRNCVQPIMPYSQATKFHECVSTDQTTAETRADDVSITPQVKIRHLKEQMLTLQEEKGVVEAALDMEIMNNEILRNEILDLQSQARNDSYRHAEEIMAVSNHQHDVNHDEEIRILEEILAVNEIEIEYAEKYVFMFSEENVGLMHQIAIAIDEMKERIFLCEGGLCPACRKLQHEVTMLSDQVSHENAVAEKIQLLAQEELALSSKQALLWREKYETAARLIMQLEQQICTLKSNNEQTALCNLDLRKSLALVHSNQHRAANALLWRFSHHATKSCIQDLMDEHPLTLTSRSDSTSADGIENKPEEMRMASIALSCRGSSYVGGTDRDDSEPDASIPFYPDHDF